MVCFTPPTVVDVIVMVTCTRYRSLEEVRILTNSSCTHETATRVTMNTHLININERVTVSQLFDSILMVSQRIVAHIAITPVMIPFRTVRVSTALTYGDYNKASLSQTVCSRRHASKRINGRFCLRTWIHIVYNRINLG